MYSARYLKEIQTDYADLMWIGIVPNLITLFVHVPIHPEMVLLAHNNFSIKITELENAFNKHTLQAMIAFEICTSGVTMQDLGCCGLPKPSSSE